MGSTIRKSGEKGLLEQRQAKKKLDLGFSLTPIHHLLVNKVLTASCSGYSTLFSSYCSG